MSDADVWAANQKFLDRAIGRGDVFVLASDSIRPGSFVEKEIKYLLGKGYVLSPDRIHLVPRR